MQTLLMLMADDVEREKEREGETAEEKRQEGVGVTEIGSDRASSRRHIQDEQKFETKKNLTQPLLRSQVEVGEHPVDADVD